jgi:hypothetical protein
MVVYRRRILIWNLNLHLNTEIKINRIETNYKSFYLGQGTCENFTRCICDDDFYGTALFFDVGDTDCPIHRLGFMALGYIQFGFSKKAFSFL